MILLTALAGLLGLVGGAAAWVLLHLIAFITSVAVFGRVGFHPPSYAHVHAGPRIV
ncbi:MAG: hypothetical protein QOI99_721, partial [Actinomycetota bacterium]|nr:hypothetical protein [Actinomycetota bacterium]